MKSARDHLGKSLARRSRNLKTGLSSIAIIAAGLGAATNARAQAAPVSNLVSVCSGVSLPRSVVTDILSPVINGVVAPIQDTVNPILGTVGVLLPLVPPLNIDATALLNNAANGQPITLQVLNANGTVVGPADRCDSQADSYTLGTPHGISLGGNRITGLGATGQEANAGEINSIALGNLASTDATSVSSIAIGQNATVGANSARSIALGSNASVTTVNSLALGAGSIADRGPVMGYAAFGLVAPQNSAGEVSIGSAGALRQITNVAAGTADSDAATVGQLTGVANQIGAVADGAVLYDAATRDRVTLAGVTGTTIGNLTPGMVSATSTEAVNGSQLFAVSTGVTTNNLAIVNLTNNINNGAIGPVRYSNPATPDVPNGGSPTDDLTLVGVDAGAVGLHNVRDGMVVSGSTDAVNGGQLFLLQSQFASAALDSVQYDGADHLRVTLGGVGGTTITNVHAGVLDATSTDAVNGAQLAATNAAVATNTTNIAGNTTAITNLGNSVTNLTTTVNDLSTSVTNLGDTVTNLGDTIANGGIGPVQYSNPDDPTVPNGGVPTNDLTLVGAAPGAVGLHNVAAGVIGAGSTDAVNGSQVYQLGQSVANAVTYNTDADGNRTNTVTLVGGNAAPVTITNVAAGTLAAGSTEAVNGGQLFATNQTVATVQVTANTALTLSQNSVQYDGDRTNVTLNQGGTAVSIHNVAAGSNPTDAVNVMQLDSGLNAAITTANNYTDSRIAAINYDLRSARSDARAGTSSALAAAGLPQAYEAGKGMIAIGGGVYGDASAVAVGFSKAFNDSHTVVKMGASYDSSGMVGASGGIGYQF